MWHSNQTLSFFLYIFNFTTDTVYMGIKKITEKKHKEDKLSECVYAFICSWSYFMGNCVFDINFSNSLDNKRLRFTALDEKNRLR